MDIRPLGAMRTCGGLASAGGGAGGRREGDARRDGDLVSLGAGAREGANLYAGKFFLKITGSVELTSGEFDSSAGI